MGRVAGQVDNTCPESIATIGKIALKAGGCSPAGTGIGADLIGDATTNFLAAQTEAEVAIVTDPIGARAAAIAEVSPDAQGTDCGGQAE
jgi:hypothetical protein